MNKNTANGFEVRPYRAGDEEELLARGLRESDRLELWKLTGLDEATLFKLRLPELKKHQARLGAALWHGNIIALFGVCPADCFKSKGIPWLLAHPDFERQELAVPIARVGQRFTRHWLNYFEILENVCDPKNTKAMNFLSWLGFKFDFEQPLRGPLGHPLLRFWRIR